MLAWTSTMRYVHVYIFFFFSIYMYLHIYLNRKVSFCKCFLIFFHGPNHVGQLNLSLQHFLLLLLAKATRLIVKLLSSQFAKGLLWYQSRAGLAPPGGPSGSDSASNCATHLSGDAFLLSLSSFPLNSRCGVDSASFRLCVLQGFNQHGPVSWKMMLL